MIASLLELLMRCLCALPVWGILRGLSLLMLRPRLRPLRELALSLFAVFMAGVLYMALDGTWAAPQDILQAAAERLQTGDRIHLQPFQTIGPQLRNLPSPTAAAQLLGNVLLFAPWGFCLPLLWQRFRTPMRMIGMALLLTGFIECTQLFIDRFVEVDDLLLNFLGSMLGTGAWRIVHKAVPQADALFLAE